MGTALTVAKYSIRVDIHQRMHKEIVYVPREVLLGLQNERSHII